MIVLFVFKVINVVKIVKKIENRLPDNLDEYNFSVAASKQED